MSPEFQLYKNAIAQAVQDHIHANRDRIARLEKQRAEIDAAIASGHTFEQQLTHTQSIIDSLPQVSLSIPDKPQGVTLAEFVHTAADHVLKAEDPQGRANAQGTLQTLFDIGSKLSEVGIDTNTAINPRNPRIVFQSENYPIQNEPDSQFQKAVKRYVRIDEPRNDGKTPVTIAGKDASLTAKELEFLNLLIQNNGKAIPHAEIAKKLGIPYQRSVTILTQIRFKFGKERFLTIGIGQKDPEQPHGIALNLPEPESSDLE